MTGSSRKLPAAPLPKKKRAFLAAGRPEDKARASSPLPRVTPNQVKSKQARVHTELGWIFLSGGRGIKSYANRLPGCVSEPRARAEPDSPFVPYYCWNCPPSLFPRVCPPSSLVSGTPSIQTLVNTPTRVRTDRGGGGGEKRRARPQIPTDPPKGAVRRPVPSVCPRSLISEVRLLQWVRGQSGKRPKLMSRSARR